MAILSIALQKSGRLQEGSLGLIGECGIHYQDHSGSSRLKSEAFNFPAEFLFLRDDDIPRYVADGVADLGIVGENVVLERGAAVNIIERLGFSRCSLVIAVPRASRFNSLSDLEGCGIATSYPHILQKFLEQRGVSAKIHEISGSVEIAPSIGLAESICDLVGTGSTLISNGLRPIETVLKSEAVLISNSSLAAEKQAIVERFCFRIRAVREANDNKYILLNAPNDKLPEIISVLPGMKSPTVLPLAIEGWSSVHSVVREDDFWEIIENLKRAGAQGILVVPIEKMII
jgi:ATP phosphoribosyltransferase